MLPLILGDLEYFRARLSFRPRILDAWDRLTARLRTISEYTDDQGIERGWAVGTQVVVMVEAGAGPRFMQEAMRLADQSVAEGRWSKLDACAFRILFGEMVVRSHKLKTPPPEKEITDVQNDIKVLHKFLDENDVVWPIDWRAMSLDEAGAILLNQSHSRSDDN